MTNAVQSIPAESGAPNDSSAATSGGAPESWREVRDNSEIQFEELGVKPPEEIVPPEPREPSWLEEVLTAFFSFLGEIFAPVGQLIAIAWPVLQWVLLGLAVVFVLYMVLRSFGPLSHRIAKKKKVVSEPEWQPDREESVALLEDADRLAAEGRFDEATHLLLQRSVGQIATERPDWVDPSSTARELAALPALSEAARSAFSTISQRVERSLFALSALDRTDWEAARSAYANFALAKIEAPDQHSIDHTPQRKFGRKVSA
ncbi:MAG: hypothetical protein ABJN35_06780 [Erythrobacter sp.]